MSFPKQIREDILVASARHCCVCHRYKGVKVEVHHIVPKEQGGTDKIENAIALCFDCHSDAGHYFAKHPKGTKFSPSELRKHKDVWFEIVKNKKIPTKDQDLIHTRYLVTKEFEILKELSQGSLDRFPVSNSLLVQNNILKFFVDIFKEQNFRRLELDNFLNLGPEEYTSKYPDAKELSENEYGYRHFYHERKPTYFDIKKVCSDDGLANYLLQSGIEPSSIAKVLTCFEGECAGIGRFQELFILRPFYIQFLVLTNVSTDYVTYKQLACDKHGDLLTNNQKVGNHSHINFPNVSIAPNQSVVVPIGIFLAEYEDLQKSDEYIRTNVIDGDRSIVLDHTLNSGNQKIEYLGVCYKPKTLKYIHDSQDITQSLHEFDFNNLYWIDGYWNCGSCPHLFFENNNQNLVYVGEIFATSPNTLIKESIIVPDGVSCLVISELEEEVTTINGIYINGHKEVSKKNLFKGDVLKIQVQSMDRVKIEGYYNIFTDSKAKFPRFEKHVMIQRFSSSYYSKYQ